jgi:hypothetical protein
MCPCEIKNIVMGGLTKIKKIKLACRLAKALFIDLKSPF